MSKDAIQANFSKDAREIYNKYLKYNVSQESFLFGKGTSGFSDKWVWVAKTKDTYTTGEIIKEAGDKCTVRTKENEEVTVDKKKLDFINPPKFDGVEDCAQLSHLNEPAVLYNLKKRYDADIIYTYSGLFLVVLNPYKRLPIYNPEIVEIYKGKRRNEMAPHVYSISDSAYRSMLNDRLNQSILITGESGAGKTENTKKVIQYMASIAGRVGGGGKLEEQVLQANPILESFGNAKTTRNNNSSRFGKFIEIQFNTAGFIAGASIISYLLEKSRVVRQAQNERTFHIFYQVLAGVTSEQKKTLRLEDPSKYNFINKSGCYTVKGIDDKEEFNSLLKAMDIMNFTPKEKEDVLHIIAGILHLGNVQFETTFGEGSGITERTPLEAAAEVLGVDGSKLDLGLCKPRIKAGNEFVQTHLNVEKAAYSREALSKALYHRLFLWIVKKINDQLAQEKKFSFIGVLDISGFEIFQINSFEQLCINYTNEKLQQFFNHHMFNLEHEEYLREKIEWTFIDFGLDLQPTIELIEKKPMGILALLDEESLFPKGTDTTFVNKLHAQFDAKNHPKYMKPRFSKTAFGVSHYAGDVEYETAFWIDKNKDPLQDDLQTCMKKSSHDMVSYLFVENITGIGEVSDTGKQRRGKGVNFITVATQYKEQLHNLMTTLSSTFPHFIRCIIPNHKQVAGQIDDSVVLDQLRCNGVLEGIRISRKGFPNRIIYAEFLKRYYLLGRNVPRTAPDARSAVAALLDELKIDREQFRFGVTKVFFRVGQLAAIEEMRERKIGDLLITIQAASRGYVARQLYKRMTEKTVAVRIIQRNIRAWVGFKNWPWWKLFSKSRPMLKRRNFEKELEQRNKQLTDMTSQIDAEKKARTKLEQSIKDLEANLADVSSKLKKEKDTATDLADEKQLLEDEKLDMERKLKKLQDDLNEYEKDVNALEGERTSIKDKAANLQANLDAEKQARTSLEKLKAEYEAELLKLRNQHDEESSSITKLERGKQGLEQQVEELLEQCDAESKQRQNLEKLKKKLESEVDELSARLEEEVKQRGNLDKDKKKGDVAYSDIKTKYDAEATARANEEAQRKKLQVELQQLKDELDAETKKLQSLEKAKKTGDSDIDDLRDQLETVNEAKAALEKAKRKLEDDVEDMKDKLDEHQDKNKSLSDLVRKYEAEIADLKNKLEAANATIVKLEKIKEQLERQIEGLSSGIQQGVTDKTGLERLRKKLEGELNDLTQQLETEIKERAVVDKEKKKVEDSLRETKQKLDDETAAKNNQLAINKKLEEAMADLKKQMEKEIAKKDDTEKARKALQTQLEDLKDQLDESAQDKDSVVKTKKKLEDEIEALKDRVEDLDKEKAELAAKLKQKEVEADDASARVAKETESRVKLDQALKAAQRDLEQLKSSETSLDAARSELDKQKRKLESDLAQARTELETEVKEKKKLISAKTKADQDLNAANSKNSEFQVQIAQNEAKVKRLEEELTEARGAAEKANESRGAADKGKKTLQQQLEDLQEQFNDEQNARVKAEKTLRDLDAEIEDLKDKLAEATRRMQLRN